MEDAVGVLAVAVCGRSRVRQARALPASCSACLFAAMEFALGECFRDVFALHREFVEFPQPLRSQQLGQWHDVVTYCLWGGFVKRCLLSGIVPASQRTSVRLQLQRAGRILMTFEFVQIRDIMRLGASLDKPIDAHTFNLHAMHYCGETLSYVKHVFALPESESQSESQIVEDCGLHFFSDDEVTETES